MKESKLVLEEKLAIARRHRQYYEDLDGGAGVTLLIASYDTYIERLKDKLKDLEAKADMKRFIILTREDEDGWGETTQIVDTLTDDHYYAGGGEPEDQDVYRDWSWVMPLLNKLAEDHD